MKRFIALSLVFAIGLLCWVVGRHNDPFILCCMAIAGIGRRFRPVLLISTILGSAMMLISYFASMNGYIPYLVYDMGKDMLSHAFGICYRTDFAAHVLYLIMSYAILRSSKLRLWEYIMLWFETWLVWRYSAARCNTICLALFLIMTGLLHAYRMVKGRWPVIPKWTAAVHAGFCVLAFLLVGFYPAKAGDGAGASFSARITLSRQAFSEYGLSLFGQKVSERGAGGTPDLSVPYFYIDITYIRTLILYGIFMLIIYLVLMTLASARAAGGQEVILALALAIVALSGLIEHHATEYGYNILILAGSSILASPKTEQSS